MFTMILRTQWAWTRSIVGGFALIAFLMPALAWRLGADNSAGSAMMQMLNGMSLLGPMLGFLALLGPFVLAAYPWMVDADANHVYPLSLPLRWRDFVAMRFASGALTLLVPTVALFLGATLAVSQIELPDTLRAYTGALSVRFLLAALLSYSATFALQYLAGRNATRVAVIGLGALGLLFVLSAVLDATWIFERIGSALFDWPGPLAIFTEPWTLIDV